MVGIIPGQNGSANEVINAIGSNFNDTAQMIFNADYIGFDSRVGYPLTFQEIPDIFKNVFYSTFTSDDADTNTGFTYDSTNDLYISDGVTSPATLIFKDNTSESVTNAIPVINSFLGVGGTTVIASDATEVSYDVNDVFTLVKTISSINDTFEIIISSLKNTGTSPSSGAKWKFTYDDVSTAEVEQRGTGINHTEYRRYGFINPFPAKIVDKIELFLRRAGGGPGNMFEKDSLAYETSVISTIQISVSADGGSNFTNVNNTEIARPTSGTGLWRKIVITKVDIDAEDGITEQAVKFNYY